MSRVLHQRAVIMSGCNKSATFHHHLHHHHPSCKGVAAAPRNEHPDFAFLYNYSNSNHQLFCSVGHAIVIDSVRQLRF